MGLQDEILNQKLKINRRHFFSRMSVGLGTVDLGSLMIPGIFQRNGKNELQGVPMLGVPHFAPKAKRIIYLFQAGAPSQLESFDYKPLLNERMGEDLPESIRQGQRLTGMTANQARCRCSTGAHGDRGFAGSGRRAYGATPGRRRMGFCPWVVH